MTPATERTFTDALEQAQLTGDLSATVRGKVALAGLQQLQGRLRQAEATYRAAGELMARAEVNAALVDSAAYFAGLGDVLRERNDLDAAEQCLSEGRSLMRGSLITSADVVTLGHIASARVRHARGDSDGARRVLDDALRYACERDFADVMAGRLRAAQARLALLLGEQEAALAWATSSGMRSDDPVVFLHEIAYLTLARVYIAQGQRDPRGDWIDDAERLLERWLVSATDAERWGSVVEMLVLRALALSERGDERAALGALDRAVERAAPAGYVRIFVDEGEPMRRLLGRLKTTDARTFAYVSALLAAFGPEEPANIDNATPRDPAPRTSADTSPAAPMAEALTERETHVLRLLAAGASNQAIADHLVISLPTAKKHVTNILGKLQAHNRTEAVARARMLHLL